VRPDEALDAARAAAAQARARGAYGDDLAGFAIEPTDKVSIEKLMEWAVIETDPALVRSTRRLGGPITWLKRALRHLLRQELGQAYAQQSRFNLMVVTRLAELEERDRPPGP
jgi:hypothetical protein